MPGICQQSIEHIVAEAKEVFALGIPAVLLFGIPETKDAVGSDAYSDTGIIQETIRAIKREVPGLAVITDVCLCEYTDHGHCGLIINGDVDNDSTLELLAKEALSHVKAGADMGRTLEMVRAFEAASGRPIPYQIAPRRPGDIASCFAKVDFAASELGWRATLGLKDMCESTWRFQQRAARG